MNTDNTTLIEKVAIGVIPTDNFIAHELHEICVEVHSTCTDSCPVYRLTDGNIPNERREGCDCFKNGLAMLGFIRKHYSQQG